MARFANSFGYSLVSGTDNADTISNGGADTIKDFESSVEVGGIFCL